MSSSNQPPLFDIRADGHDEAVECLGLVFANEDDRRAYFTELLRDKLQDHEFRKIEGFPIGEDEDILTMSDPPYYTACPNPFLEEFVEKYGKPFDPDQVYQREPFAVDVSEGKTSQIYRAHSYHTKVPHLAIVPSILHYTDPGDIVVDGFCGSGMTGVAAQWCGNAPADYQKELEARWRSEGLGEPHWGARRVILNDLSPAATFIAANYNLPFDVQAFAEAGEQLLDEVDAELGEMYETKHTDGRTGRIEYTVWSEIFICPNCANEFTFLEEALDPESRRVKKSFPCPTCGTELTKRAAERAYETQYDVVLGKNIRTPKREPVLIVYQIDDTREEKIPDEADLALLERIAGLDWPRDIPANELPYMHMTHERARMDYAGITHLHHFFLPRPAHALAALWRKADAQPDDRIRHMLLYFVEQAIWGMSVLARYAPTHYSQVNRYLSGVFYVGSQIVSVSPRYILGGKLVRLIKAFAEQFADSGNCMISTQSLAQASESRDSARSLLIPDDSVDYVFTDPPFGENIYYADLNYLVEAWHKVYTEAKPEAIIDKAKRKTITDYESLMTRCFLEYYRVLKPGRWMTVVFHNSHNAVWTAIQEALALSGFVIADVRALDKQQGSYRQVTSSAVKQDLIVSVYKPDHEFEEHFELTAGEPEGAWEFVRNHLLQVPLFLSKNGTIEPVRERMADLLYDRMVAFHVIRRKAVPLSKAEFRKGLEDKFAERDEMFFLQEQVVEYDRARLRATEVLQLQIFVTDESSAIQWVRRKLEHEPQTFQDLQPQFMRETKGGWQMYERALELQDILADNFLQYDGRGDVPKQISSYLSDNFNELRNLAASDPHLRSMAKNRWYVPDRSKQADLEKLNERSLLREFESYRESKERRLKVVRLRALRAGFKKAWQENDYTIIIEVAEKIPEAVFQENQMLLLWRDGAVMREER